MGILDKFVGAIDNDPANCVLVVGSGLSKQGVRVGGKGLPDWDELTRLMVEYLEEHKRCPAATIAQCRIWLSEDPPRYLDIADTFRSAHRNDLDGYERFLRRHLRPDDLVDSELHRLILRIGFKGIVSYNFDLVFEKQSDKLDKIVYPDLLEQLGHFRRKGYFAKIHGCIDRPATQLVLTGSSFNELSSSPNYSRLFEAVFLSNWVLCVGFSLRDPDFQSILANLKATWDENFPPLMALMREPDEHTCADWLGKGVDILPYKEHREVKAFFEQLATHCGVIRAKSRRPANGPLRKRRSVPLSSNNQAEELREFIEEWQGAQKVAEMDALMSRHLSKLGEAVDRETWLFRVAAICRMRDRPHLCHHLIAVGTPGCVELAREILRVATQEDEFRTLSPDRVHLPVHQFVLSDTWWVLEHSGLENLLKWLLDAEWSKHGVDLAATFRHILSRSMQGTRERNLNSLYLASEHIPGAAAEIEKVVFSANFSRGHDRVESSWDKRVIEEVKEEKLRRLLFPHPRKLSPSAMLAEAVALEGAEDEYCPCIRLAARFLATDFVHRSHLGIHGFSGEYNPPKAREIVDALASLRLPRQQITVLWAINHWGEDHRGLGSLLTDCELLRQGLLVPLWWRYSSETRMRYLKENSHRRGMVPFPQWTGQDFLLTEMMGLHYDIDRDFRNEFNRSLERYRSRSNEDGYDPRPLMYLWRDQELRYETLDSPPPELVRRIVAGQVDSESTADGPELWRDAAERAQRVLDGRDDLAELVSSVRQDYVIDNLLGAYFPSQHRIVLYPRMLTLAATDMEVDCEALSTVVYIHETVHAFAHVGRDLTDRAWDGYSVPEPQTPQLRLSRTIEGIAQFYTYKLLEWVGDERLLDAFTKLEEHSDPIYRGWREADHYSLEAMRAVLMRMRDAETEWPPFRL